MFVRFAPLTLLTPFAGVLADRFDNRRSLLVTNLGSMAVAAMLAAVTLSGRTSLLPIYLLAPRRRIDRASSARRTGWH